MLRLVGLMISIGFADSLNPSTIAPALYLATGERDAMPQVIQFSAAVFAVYLLGGLIVALGPGQLLLALLPHPGPHLKYVLEIVAGGVLLTGSAFLWGYRGHLSQRKPPQVRPAGRSGALLGATITAVELPTAFPYFAAIAAVVPSGQSIPNQILLIVIFNVAFVLPLLAIIAVLRFDGGNAQRHLIRGRAWLEARWPVVLAVLGLLAGLFVLFLGISGLVGLHRTRAGEFARDVRGLLSH